MRPTIRIRIVYLAGTVLAKTGRAQNSVLRDPHWAPLSYLPYGFGRAFGANSSR